MSDILKDLEYLIPLLSRPIPQAIWFIDEPARYHQVLSACIELPEREAVRPFTIPIDGLPLREWRLHEIEERVEAMRAEGSTEEMINKIFPFRKKGVWVQMSNGKHIEMVFEEKPSG